MTTLTDGTYRANLRIYQNGPGLETTVGDQAFTLIAWNTVAEQLHRLVGRGDRLLVQGKLVNRKLELAGRTIIKAEIHIAFFTVLSTRSITRRIGLAAEPAQAKYASHE